MFQSTRTEGYSYVYVRGSQDCSALIRPTAAVRPVGNIIYKYVVRVHVLFLSPDRVCDFRPGFDVTLLSG